ncbi:MAG TPA: cobyric acid synthase [Bacillota bacterium]|nr:cobyric acid synthase [Bacillota bacterium]
MAKALPLMIQGTSSDAGKSVLVTAFCRIFKQRGYRTAPFKSQNMALNSFITVDGLEIGRAQGVQAEACGIEATTNMNPILIKPTRDHEAQIVVHGKPFQNMLATSYRTDFFERGLQIIHDAYEDLAGAFDRVVIEGAGSPAEINLNERELVNMRVARLSNAPVILVTDIERGGAFASLVGTLQLLEPRDRERVIGVVINKFRGDLSLLQSGLDWFEEYTGKPVLGVIPYIPHLYIDAEDSLILDSFVTEQKVDQVIDVAVIRYPRISNFTDVDPFLVEPDCRVRYVSKASDLGRPDLVILPGSKNTLEDLAFLKTQGLEEPLRMLSRSGTWVMGICGGYQMLGNRLLDPYQVESSLGEMDGLGLLAVDTVLLKEKKTTRSVGQLCFDGCRYDVTGYEIHMGQSNPVGSVESLIQLEGHTDGALDRERRVMGTYFHGIFHNDEFRWSFLDLIRREKGLGPMESRVSFLGMREQAYDTIAEVVREHVRLDLIEEKMKAFQQVGMEEKVK